MMPMPPTTMPNEEISAWLSEDPNLALTPDDLRSLLPDHAAELHRLCSKGKTAMVALSKDSFLAHHVLTIIRKQYPERYRELLRKGIVGH